MTRPASIIACAFLLAAGGCASRESAPSPSASSADDKIVALGVSSPSHADRDEVVTLDQCPAAVQATIEAHLNGGTIREIERTTDHGEVLYEVDVLGAGGVFEFDVAEDGTFRGFETDDDEDGDDADDDEDETDEDEQEIPLSDVPDHVKQAAIAAVPGLRLKEAVRELEDNTVVYELEGEANGQAYVVEVSAAGEVLEIELGEDDERGDDDQVDD